MFGHDSRLLTTEESEFVAKTSDFICIEKQHGRRTLGGAELGAKHEIDLFHKQKPTMKALFYFNSAYAYTSTTYARSFKYGTVKGPQKSWFVVDPKTGELAHRDKVMYFDVLNPDLREWWSATVAKGVRETGADGLFVDQMHGFVWLRPDKRKEVQEAQAEMMQMAKGKIGQDKILLLNNAAHIPKLFEIGDAFMFEHYKEEEALDSESLLKDWALLKKISSAGKIAVWRIGVPTKGTPLEGTGRREARTNKIPEFEKLAKGRCETYLAAFLIGAREYSYFQYGWGWGLKTGAVTDFPEFSKPLGKPKGDYTREGDICTREFEHASVRFDLKRSEGTIAWR